MHRIGEICLVWALCATMLLPSAMAQEEEVKTGNKPSTFNYRINPYVRHNAFENEGTTTDYSLFAMAPVKWPWALDGAFVYEGPIVRHNDFEDVNTLPAAARTEETGFGDAVLRAPGILKPFEFASLNWTPVIIPEVTIPIGSDDVSGETFIGSPGGGFVISSPNSKRWFLAAIQFYDFDIAKSSGRPDVNRVRLRYFWQYLLSPKHKIYVMPEFQAVFDFEEDENSFWIAPEIGKVFSTPQGKKAGFVAYVKPGVGFGNRSNSFEREWSVEVGIRWMWNAFPFE